MFGKAQGLVEQRLVGNDLAHARPGVRCDHQLGRGVINARRQSARGEAAEHHRMDGADAHGGQHGENSLGHHGHVDQDSVAFFEPQALIGCGPGGDFGLQFQTGVGALGICLGGDADQRRVFGPLGRPAVDGVIAKIGLAAGKPRGEGRTIEGQRLFRGNHPVNARSLAHPEAFRIADGGLVQFAILLNARHDVSPQVLGRA